MIGIYNKEVITIFWKKKKKPLKRFKATIEGFKVPEITLRLSAPTQTEAEYILRKIGYKVISIEETND